MHRLARIGIAILAILVPGGLDSHGAGLGTVKGKITIKGTPPKARSLDLSKDPTCAKMRGKTPLLSENVVVGPDDALQNVVVYISTGETDPGQPPASAVTFSQQDCRFTNHVVVLRVGQEVSIVNDDPLPHNVHVMAKTNREWNKMQLPGAPPFSYSFSSEEFILTKCNIHPWMVSYLAVLKTNHFQVTGADGTFALPALPPGTYTLTAWHETYGSQSQELIVHGNEAQTVSFVF